MTYAKTLGGALLAIALGTGSALAADGECTEAQLEAKQDQLFEFMSANEDKEAEFEEALKAVEAKYGGEPPREKQCEAMDKLLERVKAL